MNKKFLLTKALVVIDNQNVANRMAGFLANLGHQVEIAGTQSVSGDSSQGPWDLVITDRMASRLNSGKAPKKLFGVCPTTAVLLCCNCDSGHPPAIEALSAGAFDYVTEHCQPMRLERVVSRALVRREIQQKIRFRKKLLGFLLTGIPASFILGLGVAAYLA